MGHQEDTELIPGTEVVYRGTDGESVNSKELVLIPAPSNNPDDPLNWSTTWKTIVIVNQFVFVFVSILTPLAIAPLTQIFEAEFQKSLAEVNLLFGVAAIVLGWANFIIVPCANVFGRRPVIIVCCLICFLANIWQALVTSFPSFLGARVISGLGAAANESIMPMVVADLLFVHQRGRSMALYFWAYFLGIFIGPIIAGSIAAQVTWRWFFWLCAILQAASLIFIIVLHPETKYERENNNNNNTAMAAASKSIANHSASAPVEARASSSGSENDTKREEAGVATQPTLTTEPKKTLGGVASPRGSSQSQHSSATNTTHGGPFPARIVGKPSKAQLSLIPRPQFAHGLRNVLRDVVSPLQIFSFPIILWAAFTFGFACNCLLALNLTEAQVFGPPPYLFNPAQIGYTNFAFFVGAAIALLTAGPLSDWIALRSARRNGGVLEAEMRLITVVPYVCCCLVGMVVTAVGYQRGWPWEVVVVVGYGLVGIEVVGVPAVVISYAVDSYKSLPGEIMIAATVVKNTFGFGMVFFFNDWAARQGFIAPVLTIMAVTVGLSVIGLAVFIPFGKKFRRATKDSALHSL